MSEKARPAIRLPFVIAFIVVSLVGAVALGTTVSSQATQRMVESSVVKIVVHSSAPNLVSPWQKEGTKTTSGSGVLIEGNRILTNAHVIEDAVSIEVKRAGMAEQFAAEVGFIAHECDLALLTVPSRGLIVMQPDRV